MTNGNDISPDIIFRALRASVVIAVVFALVLSLRFGWRWSGEFLFYSFWSVANLWLLSGILITLVSRRRALPAMLKILGLGVLIVILLLFLKRFGLTLSTFMAGFHLPWAVVLLKIGGFYMTSEQSAGDLKEEKAPAAEQGSDDV